jgi:uncharacterized membrane protein
MAARTVFRVGQARVLGLLKNLFSVFWARIPLLPVCLFFGFMFAKPRLAALWLAHKGALMGRTLFYKS